LKAAFVSRENNSVDLGAKEVALPLIHSKKRA